MRKLWCLLKSTALLALTVLLVSACSGGGGGGSGTTISGVAAAGAPIIGTVYIKDSKGAEKSVAVDATQNGQYSIDVSGMTPPFIMKAVGTVGSTQVTYCSAATTDDIGKNVNITPFTDLIVATIAGQIASNYYGGGDASKITTTALTTQVQALANQLTPVLQSVGLGSSTDLLRMSFTPGVSGLDKVMDIVKVSVNPTTTAVTITNIIDNSTVTAPSLTAMNTGGMGTMTGTLTAATVAQLSDIDQINAGIQSFVKTFATSIPTSGSAAYTAALNTLDPSFMDNGRNRDNFLNEVTSSGDILGVTAGPATFLGTTLDSNKNITAAVVEFVITMSPKFNSKTETIQWRFQKTSTGWYPLGNGRILDFDFGATAYKNQSSPATNPSKYGTGLQFYVSDDYNSSGVVKVVVTGPGLPLAGLALYNQQANTANPSSRFTIDPTGANGNNVYWLAQDTSANDASILSAFSGANDSNIPYTVTLYDSLNAQKAQYTIKISKRPYTYGELTSTTTPAPFATLTAPAVYTDLASFKLNTAQTITWTMVAGTTADWINVNIFGASTSVAYNKKLLPAQTTLTDTISGTFTPVAGNVYLTVNDQYMRMLSTAVGGM